MYIHVHAHVALSLESMKFTHMFIFKAVLYLGVLKMAWLYLRKYMYVTAFSLGHTL